MYSTRAWPLFGFRRLGAAIRYPHLGTEDDGVGGQERDTQLHGDTRGEAGRNEIRGAAALGRVAAFGRTVAFAEVAVRGVGALDADLYAFGSKSRNDGILRVIGGASEGQVFGLDDTDIADIAEIDALQGADIAGKSVEHLLRGEISVADAGELD